MYKTISQAKEKAVKNFDSYNLDLILGIEKDLLTKGKITPAEKSYILDFIS